MLVVVNEGDYEKANKYLTDLKDIARLALLDKYGRIGVQALMDATPKETGHTAASWYYEVDDNGEVSTLSFFNSYINKGVPIAIILQYGHGTGTGGYVQGRDYINPALQPVFDQMIKDFWEEVTNL